MASPKERQGQSRPTKMLLIGDSGMGKTCSIISLADAGYNVRLLDLDNGADTLENILFDSKSPYKNDPASRIDIQTRTEEMRMVNGMAIPAKGNCWTRVSDCLNNWKDEPQKGPDGKPIPAEKSYGNIATWGPQDVLVVDSLSRLAMAALYFHQSMNGSLGAIPDGYVGQKQIGTAQGYVERLLALLCSDQIKCNVIVISHIDYVEDKSLPLTFDAKGNPQDRPRKGYPRSIGSALASKIPTYFNTMLQAEMVGTRRVLTTRSNGLVPVKNTAPLRVPASYPLETGLAQYFADTRSSK